MVTKPQRLQPREDDHAVLHHHPLFLPAMAWAVLILMACVLALALPTAAHAAGTGLGLQPLSIVRPPAPINDRGPTRPNAPNPPPTRETQTIPWWSSSFMYGGQTYPYAMVGTDPALGATTTVIRARIVPLRFVFQSDGQVIDDPGMVSGALASPVFTPVDVGLGPLQWHNLVQRISLGAGAGYQTVLQPDVLPTQTVNVPADQGFTIFDPLTQRRVGVFSFDWAKRLARQLIQALQIAPTELPVFLAGNTIVSLTSAADCMGPSGCNALAGFHDGFGVGVRGATVPPRFYTYAWAQWRDFGPALPPWFDLRSEPLSHEIAEWAADPFVANIVPPWPYPTALMQCSALLEVADPVEIVPIGLAGPDGRVTAVTNAATLSWFAREAPSRALFGLYDLTGRVTQPAPACP